MEFVIVFLLVLIGLFLFAVEIFVAPGISLAGIGAGIVLLGTVYYAFVEMGMMAGSLVLGISLLGIIGLTLWFMKSKTMDKLTLKKSLDYRYDPLQDCEVKVGSRGCSITRLALIGNVEIDGHIVEAQSASGFIEENTPIEVIRVNDRGIFVRAVGQS